MQVRQVYEAEIHAADGTQTLTDVRRLAVEDPNFKWKKLSRGQVTIYWAEGSNAFATSASRSCVEPIITLARSTRLTPAYSIGDKPTLCLKAREKAAEAGGFREPRQDDRADPPRTR